MRKYGLKFNNSKWLLTNGEFLNLTGKREREIMI